MSDSTGFPEPTGLGAMLRTSREQAGMSVDDVARLTSVRSSYLEALESEDATNLPEEVYARNFVRLYARAVHLDVATALAAYDALGSSSTLPSPAAPVTPGPPKDDAEPAPRAAATPMTGRAQRPAMPTSARSSRLRSKARNVLPFVMTVAVVAALVTVAVWGFNRLLDRSTSPTASSSVTTGGATTTGTTTTGTTATATTTDGGATNAPDDGPSGAEEAASEETTADEVANETAPNDTESVDVDAPTTAADVTPGSVNDSADADPDDPAASLPDDVLLTVTSDPPGAEVTIDAFALPGVTPIADAPVSARPERTVRVELEGFVTYETVVDLTQDRDLLVTLERLPGLVDDTEPEIAVNTVVVEVRERTWLEAYQSTERGVGERLVYTTAQPGERFEFSRPLYLHLGNAGGIDVTVDGETIPPLGSSGAVLGQAFPASDAP